MAKAKAKKKLNTNFLIAVASVVGAVAVLGGGVGLWMYKNQRPDQLKNEARELMLNGEYTEAFNRFSRAGSRKTSDAEFLIWMQETENHLTSFDTLHYRATLGLHDAIIAASSDKVPPTLKKLQAFVNDINWSGVAQYPPDTVRDLESAAKLVLERDPKTPDAHRIRAYLKIMPLFTPGAVTSSAEAQTVMEAVKAILEESSYDPDVAIRYAQTLLKHREALLREGSISDSPSTSQARETYAEIRRVSDHLTEASANESLTADQRARLNLRNHQLIQLVLQTKLLPPEDDKSEASAKERQLILTRMFKAIEDASALVTPDSDLYVLTRLNYADFMTLPLVSRFADAEKALREMIAAKPKQLRARMELAEMFSDLGRPLDAVEVLNVQYAPDYELTGIDGLVFQRDSDRLPLRRAFYRLASLGMIDPDKRDAEVVRAETDYKEAISHASVGEADPYAMQIQAVLQEMRQDRTGAISTLNSALTRLSDAPEWAALKVKIFDQLMRLHLTLSQTGRAEEIAEELVKRSPLKLEYVLQLMDLQIRNDHKDRASLVLKRAKETWKGADEQKVHPALAVYEMRLMPDDQAREAAYRKFPEDTRELVELKIRMGNELGFDVLAEEVAARFLQKNPDDYRVTMLLVQNMLKQNRSEDALRRLNALKAKDPADTNLDEAIAIVNASDNPEKLQKIMEERASNASPVNKLLVEADQLRLKGDVEGFVAKMREAEKADTSGLGLVTERIYYYYMQTGKVDEAERELNKLAGLAKRDPAEIRINRLRLSLVRVDALKDAGKFDEAARLLEQTGNDANKLVSEMPNFSGALIVRGLTQNARGQFTEAYGSFQAALAAQPGNQEALQNATNLAFVIQRGDDAQKYIDRGKKDFGNTGFFELAQLRYHEEFGDPSAAIEDRIKLRDAQPDAPGAWVDLGRTYTLAAKKATDATKVGEYRKKAIETFLQAKEKFPASPGFGLTAASVMKEDGDTQGAARLVDSLANDAAATARPDFLQQLARYYIDENQLDSALSTLQKLQQMIKGDDVGLRMQIAQLYAGMNKVDQALAEADRLPDSPQTRELKINMLLSAGKTDEANQLANSILAKEKNATTLMMAAHTEGVVLNVKRSVDLASEAVALDGGNPATHLVKAKMMMREKPMRNPEILEELDTVKKLSPGNIEARVLMSERLAALGRNDEAVGELELIVKDLPTNIEAKVRLIQAYRAQNPPGYSRIDAIFAQLRKESKMDVRLLTLETSVARQRKDIQAAVKSAREALLMDKQNVALYRQLVDVSVEAGAYREVLTALDEVEKQSQSIYWTYMIRGLVQHRLKNEPEAAKQWDKALSVAMSLRDERPTGEVVEKFNREYGSEVTGKWLVNKMGDNVKMRALMLGLYADEGRFAQVIQLSDEVLASMEGTLTHEAQVAMVTHVGNAYLANSPSNPGKAREMFERLVRIEPNNAQSLNNLAYAMMLEGADLPGAAKIAKQAYDLTTRSGEVKAEIIDTYGWALVQSGKVQEGIDVLREGAAIKEIPDIAYHLGEAYILEQQKDAAEQSLQKALALVKNAGKNGTAVDGELERRINDAIARAATMSVQ